MPRTTKKKSIADANAAPGGVAAVDRALTLLAAFKNGDKALSLAELAERTGLYKSTVLRLLASLEHGRLVQRLEGGPQHGSWALDSEVVRLNAIYASSFSMESIVLPVLQDLVNATGESAAFHVRQGKARLCLYRVDSPHPIRDHIKAGDLLDPLKGAGARVLIAYGESPEGPIYQNDKELYENIRSQGYCANKGDRLSEVAGISAPVYKLDGALAGALTLTLPVGRYDERHIEPVIKAAQRLSGRM